MLAVQGDLCCVGWVGFFDCFGSRFEVVRQCLDSLDSRNQGVCLREQDPRHRRSRRESVLMHHFQA